MNVLLLAHLTKAFLCAAAIGLVLAYCLAKKHHLHQISRNVTLGMLLVALISIPAYFDFFQFPKHGSFMNPHGWFHYYMGAKYSKEVGYYDLYPAVVIGNMENNGRLIQHRMRDLKTYRVISTRKVLRDQTRYKNLFTPERWSEFKRDLNYFQRHTKPKRWPGVVLDKGYNATPMWNMVGAALTNVISTANKLGMSLLLSVDFVLLTIAMCFVWHAFGVQAALLLTTYFACHFAFFLYGVNELRGGLLRFDWLAGIIIGVCQLKQNRFKTAGALFAYSSAMRIFPLILIFGIVAKALVSAIVGRGFDKRYTEFFAVFSVTALLFYLSSVLWDGGLSHWYDFIKKITMHDSGIAGQRTGFKYIFLSAYEGYSGKAEYFETQKMLWWSIQAGVLLLIFCLVQRLTLCEAVALSYVPLFFLTAPTTYYQISLVVPLLVYLSKIGETEGAIGASLLFFVSIMFIVFDKVKVGGTTIALSYSLSIILLCVCLFMVITAWIKSTNYRLDTFPFMKIQIKQPLKFGRGSKSGCFRSQKTNFYPPFLSSVNSI